MFFSVVSRSCWSLIHAVISFQKEMTAWISEQEDLDTALKNIDDSWPAS